MASVGETDADMGWTGGAASVGAPSLGLAFQVFPHAQGLFTDQGGKITMRRLNRREYQNSLREILGVDVEVSSLPADGSLETIDVNGSSACFGRPRRRMAFSSLMASCRQSRRPDTAESSAA